MTTLQPTSPMPPDYQARVKAAAAIEGPIAEVRDRIWDNMYNVKPPARTIAEAVAGIDAHAFRASLTDALAGAQAALPRVAPMVPNAVQGLDNFVRLFEWAATDQSPTVGPAAKQFVNDFRAATNPLHVISSTLYGVDSIGDRPSGPSHQANR